MEALLIGPSFDNRNRSKELKRIDESGSSNPRPALLFKQTSTIRLRNKIQVKKGQ